MSNLVSCVEVVEQGGGDHVVQHRLFAITKSPSDPWMEQFVVGSDSDTNEFIDWRLDIIRPFPLDLSEETAKRFAPEPPKSEVPQRVSGLLKYGDLWRWEPRNVTHHASDVYGVPSDRRGEGTVIGSAWFEFSRKAKETAKDRGIQPPSLWGIMAIEGMVDSLRAAGLRPRVVFWIEGGSNG
jgi:hypothetical protein